MAIVILRRKASSGNESYTLQCKVSPMHKVCEMFLWVPVEFGGTYKALPMTVQIYPGAIARIYAHIVGNRMPKRLDTLESIVDRYGSLMPRVIQSPKSIGHKSERYQELGRPKRK